MSDCYAQILAALLLERKSSWKNCWNDQPSESKLATAAGWAGTQDLAVIVVPINTR
jgi:hypothetical protein